MAYRYKRRYRRRTYRRRRTAWYNKKYSVAQLASKAMKGVRYLSGLVNSEKFKHDQITAGSFNNNGNVIHLTNIGQGDDDGQRTGNSIFVRGVSIRGTLSKNSSSTDSRVRLMLVIDKQQVGDTNPAVSDILDSTGTSLSVYSFLNDTTVGRFTILKSRMYALTEDTPTINVNWHFNLRHHVRYNGPLASDVQRGGIYLVGISNEATNAVSFARAIRVSYHDN